MQDSGIYLVRCALLLFIPIPWILSCYIDLFAVKKLLYFQFFNVVRLPRVLTMFLSDYLPPDTSINEPVV